MKVQNVKMHLECGSYQFVECDLPEIIDFNNLMEVVKEAKANQLKAKYICEHIFFHEQLSKKGLLYRKCLNCEAMCFEQFGEKGKKVWGQWVYPANKDYKGDE